MLLLVSLAAAALQQPQVSDAVMREILNYSECASVRAIVLARGDNSGETIADAALSDCGEHEQALRSRLAAEYHDRAGELLREVRSGVRRSLVETVAATRGDAIAADPFRTWGQCLGTRSIAAGRAAMSPDAVADAALAECREQEEAARQDALRKMGEPNGEAAMRNFRDQFRGMVIRNRSGQLGNPG